MSFKKDFVQAITQLGRMPFTCVEEALAHQDIERIHTEERIRREMEGLPKQVFDLQQMVLQQNHEIKEMRASMNKLVEMIWLRERNTIDKNLPNK